MILSADLRIRDAFSGTFSKAFKDTTQIQSKLKIIGAMTVRPVVRLKDETVGQISKIKNGLFSLQGAATMALGAFGIGKLGEATIGAAAKSELQLKTMQAVLKDQQKAREYMAWTMQESADTMFNDVEMMTSALSLTPYARENISDFKEMMRTAEVLASINPAEGMAGGAFALREALSGDFVSLQERFNLPRSVINQLKEGKTTAKEYLQVVQKAAENLGFTYETVKEQGRTSIGLWNSITGNINAMFRSTGEGMLESIQPRLQKISDWFDKNQDTVAAWKSRLVSLGQETFEGILSKGEYFLGGLMAKFDDPGFQELDWQGKLSSILDDVQTVVVPKAGEVASKIGAEFGSKFAKGVISTIESDRRVGLLVAAWAGLSVPGPPWAKLAAFGAIAITPELKNAGAEFTNPFTEFESRWQTRKEAGVFGSAPDKNEERWNSIGETSTPEGTLGGIKNKGWQGLFGHASGLPYVPYDNYPALLHRGERVMTAAENRQSKTRPFQSNITININGSDKSPREIAREVVKELESELIKTERNMPLVSMVY
ncbi:hypothetical protein Psfp_02745 [Pelotomaculum sp. FP]|uniref:hypothetical protein n=1 Tax=Pelotomaculum sp. FP TaxID=261474 RepID=UPI0010647A09|nr:hypothetical protein [Pelotomaculum sp. FP]TEB14604.1 hypothetical protein Psfp_02745 [Pelotomaculum sp. FP]